MNKTRVTASAALIAAVLLLAGCDDTAQPRPSHKTSKAHKGASSRRLAACEAGVRREYRRAVGEQSNGRRPRECRGVSKAQLRDIVVRVIGEETPTTLPPKGS